MKVLTNKKVSTFIHSHRNIEDPPIQTISEILGTKSMSEERMKPLKGEELDSTPVSNVSKTSEKIVENDIIDEIVVENESDTIHDDKGKTESSAASENNESTDAEEEQTEKKESLLKSILKEGPGLSALKISATALTAISMALISSQLTGFVNSLILVGLLSVGSAMMGEFYRVLLSLTSIGAKKVVLPVVKINPDGTASKIKIFATEKVSEKLAENQSTFKKSSEKDETSKNVSESVLKDSSNEKNIDYDATETIEGESKKDSWLSRFSPVVGLRKYFKRAPQMRMVLLFTVISAATIGVNYLVASNSNAESPVQYTTIHNSTKTEQISDLEKEKIVDEAVEKAKSSIPVSSPTVIVSPVPTGNGDESDARHDETDRSLQEQIEELKAQNDELQERLDKLENKPVETVSPNDGTNTPVESTPPPNSSNNDEIIALLREQIESLEETIDSLQAQIDSLEERIESGQSSETPTTEETPS